MAKQSLNLVAVGIEMGVAVAIGMFGGKWLDSHLGTEPVLFWVGVGVGLGAAAKAVYVASKKVQKEMSANEPENPDQN